MNTEEKQLRRYQRWYFNAKQAPLTQQSHGVPAEISTALVGQAISRAILKDVSAGGAGILIPSVNRLPRYICLKSEELGSTRGEVVYRRRVSSQLEFIGIRWYWMSTKRRIHILRTARRLIKQSSAQQALLESS